MKNSTKNNKTAVNVFFDAAELDEMKSLTTTRANATALVVAARIGLRFLKRIQSTVEDSIVKDPLLVSTIMQKA